MLSVRPHKFHRFINHPRGILFVFLTLILLFSFASQAAAVLIPEAGALKPDGTRLYVPNQTNGHLYIYNTSNGSQVRDINLFGYPNGMIISPDGNWLYVSISGSFPSLWVFNIGSGDPTAASATLLLNSSFAPKGIAITPNGNTIYMADSADRSIHIINVATPTSPSHVGDIETEAGGAQLPYSLYGVAIKPDGSRLYASHRDPSGHIYVYNITNPSSPTHFQTISNIPTPTYLVVSSNRLLARVAQTTSPFTDVKIYDASTGGLSFITNVSVPNAGNDVDPGNSSAAESLSLSQDGQYFYVSHYKASNGSVHTYGFPISDLGNVWEVAANDTSKDFSVLAPGGAWIYLTYSGNGSYVAHQTNPPAPMPTIDHFENSSLQTTTEAFVYDNVRIVGSNFGADPGAGNRSTASNHVLLAGLQLPSSQIYYWSDTVIEIGVPLDVSGSLIVAGSRNIRVTAGGDNSNNEPITIRPRIYAVTPGSGPIGTIVRINGTAYGNISGAVTFNGTAVANIVSWSNTTIEAEVAAGTPVGVGPVIATVNSAISNNDITFEVTAALVPTITHLENPSFQLTTEAYVYDTIRIVGTDLGADPGVGNRSTASNHIMFGTQQIPDLQVYYWSDTVIEFGIPLTIGALPVVAGSKAIVVTTSSTDTNSSMLNLRPRIYSLVPNSGPIGTSAIINGTAFGNSQVSSTITFNGAFVGAAVSWSNTSITAVVPALAATGPVIVTVNSVGSNDDQIFTVTPGATIDHLRNSLSQTTDEAFVYDTIRVMGSDFGADPGAGNRSTATHNVTLGGLQLPNAQIYSWSDTSIDIGIPLDISGTNVVAGLTNIVVTANSDVSNSEPLTVRPRIYGVSPGSGPIGTVVRIEGNAYGNSSVGNSVTINGTISSNIISWSNITIEAEVAAGTSLGVGPVIATVNSAISNDEITFEVTEAAVPIITHLENPSFQITTEAYVYDTIRIVGNDLGADPGVGNRSTASNHIMFGTQQIPDNWVYSWSNTLIEIGIPLEVGGVSVVAGLKAISVTTGGTATNNASLNLRPRIYSLTPNAGPEGTFVTIEGTAYGDSQGPNTITLNGSFIGSAVSWSNTTIEVIIPVGATTGPVIVNVQLQPSNDDQIFTVTTGATIDHFENSSLQVTDEAFVYDNVRIVGTNFGADPGAGNRSTVANNVTLAGLQLPDSQVYSWSDTVIEIGIPIDISGTDTIAGLNGIQVTSLSVPGNTSNLTIRPRIYGITPWSGPTGTIVRIEGNAYGNSSVGNSVTINGTLSSNIISWSNTTIEAEVNASTPIGVGPVIATVNSAVSNDEITFEVTAPVLGPDTPLWMGHYQVERQLPGSTYTVFVNWGASVGATNYDLRYRIVGSPTWTTISGLTAPWDNAADPNPNHQLSGLTEFVTYEVSVRANNGLGSSAWFTPEHLIYVIDTPWLGHYNVSEESGGTFSATMIWKDCIGADTYVLQYWPAGGATLEVYPLSPATTTEITGLLPGVQYYAQIKAVRIGGGESEWSNLDTFNTVPGPIWIDSFNVSSDEAHLIWDNPIAGALSYTISYGTDIDATNLGEISGLNDLDAVDYLLTGLLPNTGYYVKVKAVHAVGDSDWSGIHYFTTFGGPAPLWIDHFNVTATDAHLIWGTIGSALSYTVSYGTDVDATSLGELSGLTAAQALDYLLLGLIPNTTYFTKVKAIYTLGDSGWSPIDMFTTEASTSPMLLYLTPDNGNQGETINVTAVGLNTNFVNGITTANFGAQIIVNSVTVADTTTAIINISIPAGATIGNHAVAISTGAEILNGTFAVNGAGTPMLLYIIPDNGNQGEEITARIIGSNTGFTGNPVVTFTNPGISVTSTAAISATEIAVIISIEASAPVGICDLTAAGLSLNNAFTVNPLGTETLLYATPDNGDQGTVGLNVHIVGSYTSFLSNGVSSVNFTGTGITVNNVTVIDESEIVVNINIDNAATLGYRSITVTTGGNDLLLSNGFRVNTDSAATLLYITPDNANADDMLTVRIVGVNTNFDAGTNVYFSNGWITVITETVISPTIIDAIISIHAQAPLGPCDVRVETGAGWSGTLVNGFTITPFLAPELLTITPTSGAQGTTGLVVTATGLNTNFVNGVTTLQFSGTGITVNSVNVISSRTIEANIDIDNAALLGLRDVIVTTNAERIALGNAFEVTPAGAPSLLYLSPDNGNRGETINVTIAGSNTNFVNGITASNFGAGITTNYLTVIDSTHAVANITISGGAVLGARAVSISTGAEVLNGTFTVNNFGTTMLLYVIPNSGNQGDTLNVRIIGSNTSFAGSPAVSFTNAGITVNSTNAISPTEIVANISINIASTVGPCNVIVGGLTLNNGFTVNPAGTEMLLYASPDNGDQDTTGLNIHIFGTNTNFTGTPAVTFTGAGITVNTVNVISPTELVININIDVTAPVGYRTIIYDDGSTVLSLTNGFRVNPAGTQVLLYITPDNANQGDNLTVQVVGANTNFDGTTNISFANAGIAVNSVNVISSTIVEANISINPAAPTGADDVTVTTAGVPLALINGFTVNLVTTPEIISIVPSSEYQGTTGLVVTVTSLNTNFVNGVTTLQFSGTGITVNSVNVLSPTQFTANIDIDSAAPIGPRDVIVSTNTEIASLANGFEVLETIIVANLLYLVPDSANQGIQNLNIRMVGDNTNFADGVTIADFGAGITVNYVQVLDSLNAIANISVDVAAAIGARTVTVTTNAEIVTGTFNVIATATPTLLYVVPDQGVQGLTSLLVNVYGNNTSFTDGASNITFSGAGITVNSTRVIDATHAVADININIAAPTGPRTVSIDGLSLVNGFVVVPTTQEVIISIVPSYGYQGTNNLTLNITGINTSFNALSSLTFSGTGINIDSIIANSATSITAQIDISAVAELGARNVTVDGITLVNGFEILSNTNLWMLIDPYEGTEGIIHYNFGPSAPIVDFDTATYHDGVQGWHSLYNFTADWGGGFGGVLPGELNISNMNCITFWLQGDGSNNSVRFEIIETDGDVWSSHDPLVVGSGYSLNNTGWQQMVLSFTDLTYNSGQSTGNGLFEGVITNYNLIYTSTNGSAVNHYIDTIQAEIRDINPPSRIIDLMATKVGANVQLDWSAATDDVAVLGYRLYHSNSAAGPWAQIGPDLAPGTLTYTHNNAVIDVPDHYYYVVAFDITSEGPRSNIASIIKLDLVFDPAEANAYWVSVPYINVYTTVSDIINDQPAEVESISRFNPVTQAHEVYYRTGTGTNFSVVDGEGFVVKISSSTTLSFAGTFTPFMLNLANTGSHLISVPYDSTYTNARSIVDSINGAAQPGTTISIKRMNSANQTVESLTWVNLGPFGTWTGQNFTFVPGEAYSIEINGATTWTPSVY